MLNAKEPVSLYLIMSSCHGLGAPLYQAPLQEQRKGAWERKGALHMESRSSLCNTNQALAWGIVHPDDEGSRAGHT